MTRAKPSIRAEVADLLSWVRGAACTDPALFEIPDKNRHGTWSPAQLAQMDAAKEVCLDCPVMVRCLEHAVRFGTKGAIYGGMTDDERAEWADKQPVAV